MFSSEVVNILIKEIVTNPNQPRRFFEEASIHDLAESIVQHGLIQPIVVRLVDHQTYELIAGERRLRAFIALGESTIPAIIKNADAKNSAVLAMIENIQREDLHFIEVAKGYDLLINKYNLTQNQLASTLGKNQSTIANKLRILNLPEEVLDLIISSGLTERHGRALLKVKDSNLLIKIVKYVVKNDLNVHKTEQYIQKMIEDTPLVENKQTNEVKAYLKDLRLFTNTIKQAVDMVNQAGVDAKYVIEEKENQYTITISVPMSKGV